MRNFIRISLLIALLASAMPLSAAPVDPARHAWMGGYEAMTLAEQEEKDHAELAALRHYEQALKVFEQVRHDFPQWNVSIIQYRIEYCQKKIADIKEKNRQNTAFLSREDLVAQLGTLGAELQSAREKATVLENQLREAREALQRARAEAAAQTANEENLRILKGDREVLTAQVQKLTAQLAAAQEDLKKNAVAAKSRAEYDELRRQLETARSQLEQTNRILEQTATARDALLQQTQREAQWHTMATEQLDALREQLAETARKAEEATRQLEELRLQQQNASPEALAAINDEQATPAQLRAKLRARESELQNAQMELLNVRRRMLQLEESTAAQLQELTDLRRRAAATSQAVAEQLASAETAKQQNQQLAAQVAELKQTAASQRELLAKLETTASQNEQRAKELQKQLAAATGAGDGIGANAEDSEESLRRSQAEAAALKNQATQDARKLAEAQELIRTQQERIDELMQRQGTEAVQAAEKVWMAQVQDLRGQLEEATRRQHDLEVALIKRENEKNALAEALQQQEPTAKKELPEEKTTAAAGALPAAAGQPATLLSRQDAIILRGYLRQGVDAERAGKREAAQWNYEQALAIQPENPTALKRLGVLAYQRNDFPEAAKFLTAAFRQNPDDQDILLALGFTMLQLREPQWALAYLARANALKPQDFQTAKLFGNALGTMKWRDAAIAQLTRTLELQPNDAESAMALAMLCLTQASETEVASQQNPTHREALQNLAAAQRKKALEWYRKAVDNGAQPDPQLEQTLRK